MSDETVKTETIVTDGKTYTKKITAVGVYKWLLLFLVAVIAFVLAATWIRLGTMMDANHPYLSAMHGVYINESGKPEMRMIRVDQNGFLGILPVQQAPRPTGSLSPVPVQPPVEIPAAPAKPK